MDPSGSTSLNRPARARREGETRPASLNAQPEDRTRASLSSLCHSNQLARNPSAGRSGSRVDDGGVGLSLADAGLASVKAARLPLVEIRIARRGYGQVPAGHVLLQTVLLRCASKSKLCLESRKRRGSRSDRGRERKQAIPRLGPDHNCRTSLSLEALDDQKGSCQAGSRDRSRQDRLLMVGPEQRRGSQLCILFRKANWCHDFISISIRPSTKCSVCCVLGASAEMLGSPSTSASWDSPVAEPHPSSQPGQPDRPRLDWRRPRWVLH